MTVRVRTYVMLIVGVLLAIALGLYARGWSDVEYYGAFAALLGVVGGIGLPWIEFARDGAFRRRPQA